MDYEGTFIVKSRGNPGLRETTPSEIMTPRPCIVARCVQWTALLAALRAAAARRRHLRTVRTPAGRTCGLRPLADGDAQRAISAPPFERRFCDAVGLLRSLSTSTSWAPTRAHKIHLKLPQLLVRPRISQAGARCAPAIIKDSQCVPYKYWRTRARVRLQSSLKEIYEVPMCVPSVKSAVPKAPWIMDF